ncbi:MAG: DUF2298 domain-containing protein [Chloroflexota bacterium]
MFDVLLWLVAVEALTLAALPLAWWLLRPLPDRGLAFARPLALLAVGYPLWLGSSFGVLANRRNTIFLLILALALACWWRWGPELLAWSRGRLRLWLYPELVFLVGFLVLAIMRAYAPAISGTEKPMDFAFLNAALRAESAPPQDPWLAGFGISYYYFGYYLLALVTKLSGVAPQVAFNLSLALLFGATAAGAYSLVYNLAAGRRAETEDQARGNPARQALLAPLFLLLLANFEGAVELLRQLRALPLAVVQWLHIRDLNPLPVGASWFPSDPPDTWWWWRASRVVGTFDPTSGQALDYTINEFPFFSFLLGDLHPHVMALPFLLLALALCLALVRWPAELSPVALWREKGRAALYVLCFGALGFLNTWDLPVFLGFLSLCYLWRRVSSEPKLHWALVGESALLGLGALALGIAAYAPFWVWLRSQASGIGLVAVRTQPQHLALHWGFLLLVVAALPVVVLAGRPLAPRWRLWVALAVLVGLGLGAVGFVTFAVLLGLLGLALWALWDLVAGDRAIGPDTPTAFALLLIVTGALLIAVCELVFVRDGFGNRMNTVFKFYYQAWVLLALAAAYTIYYVGSRPAARGLGRRVANSSWHVLVVMLLLGGLAYSAFATPSRIGHSGLPPTLDGLAWLEGLRPHERTAIAWLQSLEGTPVLLEASGAEYSTGNSGSAFSGLPTVLGWAGHEYQWRGATLEPARRQAAVDTIYSTEDIATAESLLRQYNVTYVWVGDAERLAYSSSLAGLAKFARFMDVAYQNDRVTIYRLRPATH